MLLVLCSDRETASQTRQVTKPPLRCLCHYSQLALISVGSLGFVNKARSALFRVLHFVEGTAWSNNLILQPAHVHGDDNDAPDGTDGDGDDPSSPRDLNRPLD